MPIAITCIIHPEETAVFEDEAAATAARWIHTENGWVSPAALEHGSICDGCHRYVDFDADDYYDDVDDCGYIYCRECFYDRGGYCCDRCEEFHFDNSCNYHSVNVWDPNVGDRHTERWCDYCTEENAEWNDEEESYEYEVPDRNRRNRQGDMNYPVHFDPEGVKPEICPSCLTTGTRNGTKGMCPKCLENQAYNKRLRETTLWVYDKRFSPSGWYHPSDHVDFKKTVYREKNENPYLYYGIEAEVGIDRNKQTKPLHVIAAEAIEASKGLFVAESDSSVPNGIEFISRPLSYRKWSSDEIKQNLKDWSDYLIKEGAYVKQPDTNGLHIHMSRIFFEKNTEKKPEQINKDIDWVFQYFQPEIETISQRKYTRFCESKMDQIKVSSLQSFRYNLDKVNANVTINAELKKSNLQDGREYHHSVITQREHTIEVRCFRSQILPENILAYIQFVRNIAHSVRNKPIKGMTMKDLLASKESPELDCYIQTLEKRNGLALNKQVKDTLKQKIVITQQMAQAINNGYDVEL